MDAAISKHAKDLIQKYTSGLFKNATLEFYGVKTAKIKELINVELPAVEVTGSSSDFIFLLEDDTYLHFEFQTTYSKTDLIRFAAYDMRLFERDGRKVTTLIIYSADVKRADVSLNIGSLVYTPDKVMMNDYDGDAIYSELTAKLHTVHDLTDTDMLNLIFLPLMRNSIPKDELVIKSVELAQRIPDTTKRNACIAAAFAFANRYLDENKVDELLEVLEMTDLATIMIERAVERAVEKAVESAVQKTVSNDRLDFAKKMLKRGIATDAVAEDTGLDEITIKRLQNELNND